MNSSLEHAIKEKDNEIKEIISGINVEIKTINQWIDTYLGVHFDQFIEIPELPYTVSKPIKNKVKFDTLKENLVNAQKRMNNELSKCNSILKDMKQDGEEQITRYQRLINENSELKGTILKRNEEIYILQQEIETYSAEIGLTKDTLSQLKYEITEKNESFNNYLNSINNLIKSEMDIVKQNSFILNNFSELLYRSTYAENIKDQIRDGLEAIFEIFHTVVNEHEKHFSNLNLKNSNGLLSAEEIKQINDLKLDNELLESQLKEKEEQINQMSNEISAMRNMEANLKQTLKSQDNVVSVHKDDSSDKLRIMEKKVNNLMRELELKDIQIKSQEQMITRRNKELEEFKEDKKLKTQQSQHSQIIDDKLNRSLNNSKV